MPTVIGKTESEANAILREAGLKVTRREEANEANDAGKVIKQNPDPGVEVNKGSEVIITVSQGAPSATVPDVRGRGVDAATEALENAGFVVRTVRRTDDTADVDTVIDQDPKPGPGKRGATITLIVSNGQEQVRVPEVRGRPEGEAANLMGQAGFRTRTRVEQSETVDAGLVIRTEPDTGSRLDKGETVTLVVSNGAPATTLPPETTLPPVPTTGAAHHPLPDDDGDDDPRLHHLDHRALTARPAPLATPGPGPGPGRGFGRGSWTGAGGRPR